MTIAKNKTISTVKSKVPSNNQVYERLKEIIIDQLGVDETEVNLNAYFIEDLGADSLDLVELTMEIEDKFKIEIPNEDTKRITNVNEAVEYINRRIS